MRRWQGLSIGVVAVLALTAACGTGGTNTGPPPHNNTLIYGAPGEPDTLDPAAGLSGFDQYYTKSIYDTLIKTDTHVNPVVPDLATSWEFMGADKLTFRLHLRHGVLFQDGTPFNADAVKATIDHNRTTGLLTDIVPIKSETVVDDYTVDLNLSRPYSPLPAVLTGASGMMLSPTALQKYGKDFGRHPVGAGPFAFESWTAGSEVVTTRFAGYWNKGAIHFSGITYKVFGDTNAMTSALISGQIDFAQLLNLPAQSIAPLKARSNLVADVKTTLSPGIVTTDNTRPPFNNVTVRQAFERAIDRQKLVDGVLGKGFGLGPAWEYMPPNYWASTKSLKDWKYDPQQAKQMLAQAGYPNGISVNICVFSSDTIKAATIEKAQMAPAGITLNLDQEPVNACVAKLVSGGIPMVQIGAFFAASPYVDYAFMFGARAGVPQYPGVDDILAKIASLYTQQEQKPYYDQLNKLLYDTAPSIPTYWLVNPVAYTKRLQGVVFNINGQEFLSSAHY